MPVYTPPARALITLRSQLRSERIAFTLVHELGHHFLTQCRSDRRLRSGLSGNSMAGLATLAPGSDAEEETCDRFARAMLLDSRRARLWVTHSPSTIESLWNFATHSHLHVRDAYLRIAECTDHRGTLLRVDTDAPHPTVIDAFGPLAAQLQGAESITPLASWPASGHATVDWRAQQSVVRTAGTAKQVSDSTTYLLATRGGPVLPDGSERRPSHLGGI